mgnify:CR=1 FL=1
MVVGSVVGTRFSLVSLGSTVAPAHFNLTFDTRWPKVSVDSVSSTSDALGLACTIISVLELPPNESCKKNVSLELRYGMCLVTA